jgi:hypothetical protein
VTHDVRQVQGCHVLQQDTPDVALEWQPQERVQKKERYR